MDTDSFTTLLCTTALFGIVGGMILLAYEDGIPNGRLKKLLCRFGRHKMHVGFGKAKTAKYYCQYCKKPRSHPDMKVLDGGRKL